MAVAAAAAASPVYEFVPFGVCAVWVGFCSGRAPAGVFLLIDSFRTGLTGLACGAGGGGWELSGFGGLGRPGAILPSALGEGCKLAALPFSWAFMLVTCVAKCETWPFSSLFSASA